MLRGWWRVIFRIFTPQSNTLLVVYPYIPHSSWLNPTKSPCVMVSCWVKTKRKSEYPKGELPSRRTNWCQFVHRSQAEEQDVSLHWWNLDLEFDDFRDMFMGIHWVNLSNTYTYIYIYIYNQYIYIYIIWLCIKAIYHLMDMSKYLGGVVWKQEPHDLWLLKREARLSTMRFWVDPMCKKKHISGWWFQPTTLKNDGVKVNGKDDIPYMKWNIKVMFETTNQVYLHIPSGYLT